MKKMVLSRLLLFSFIFNGCVESGSRSQRAPASKTKTNLKTNANNNGNGSLPNVGDTLFGSASSNSSIELRHIVDPVDGTYSRKVTIPKNFSGYLYLSGLNVSSLSEKLVSVRFNFGQAMEPITVGATISRGPGIIPQTDIEVLILDLNDKPFNRLRLLYDLYDYNYYGTSFSEKDPVTNNRDRNLFCRGVDLDYDPTFVPTTASASCNGTTSVCKYAYAKIADKGPVATSSSLPLIPSKTQVAMGTTGVYSADSSAYQLQKCLADNGNSSAAALGYTLPLSYGGETYTYGGPYRLLNESLWQLTGSAITATFSTTQAIGIFETTSGGNYVKSLMFPRFGKLSLKKGIEHIGNSSTVDGAKSLQSPLSADGKTEWIDGCNLRVANYDSFLNEGIGSCNLTSTIQIIWMNPGTGKEEVLSESKEVKLQLVRESTLNNVGTDVLYTSLKTCSNSNMCGAGECCYNNRCWSKDLVSQCLEDSQSEGNFAIGTNCTSDYQCSSLCCNASLGKCAAHENQLSPAVLCNKSPGESCIAKEWCRKEPTVNCYVVDTGTDALNRPTCALKCYNSLEFGECQNGKCIPPAAGTIESFDPTEPDPYKRCSKAHAASSISSNGTLNSSSSGGSGGSSGSGTSTNSN